MGHGHSDRVWTIADVERVRELWKQSALAIDDDMLKVANDWGKW